MRKNLLTLGLIGLVLALLVGLNLVFISEPRKEETETNGDRSSYKGTPYGTLAYYLLLEESGRTVTRWERPYTELEEAGVGTLVVAVPHEEHQPSEEEILALESWVLSGGRLIVFDRFVALDFTAFGVSTGATTDGEVRPAAPTMLTRGASKLDVTEYVTTISDSTGESAVHFASDDGPVVIDRQYGEGFIVFVTEPHVVQNNGISKGANLAFALNLVEAYGDPGTIAFDEYHHGYGASMGGSSGGLRGYIAGTPVPWIMLQLAILGAAVAFTVGRRYGRPLPLVTERRTSALEFVGSMASIQMLAKASDLAIENIGTSFRTRLCRYAGVPSNAPAETIARAAASRSRVDERELLEVLRRCEAALDEKPSRAQLLDLVRRLRTLEQELKL
jgi:hypothetical protein